MHVLRSLRATIGIILAVVMAVVAVAQPATTVAQTTGQQGSQTVGTSTITTAAEWAWQADISDATSAFYSHNRLPGTIFLYGEIIDATVVDASGALDDFADGFFAEFGDGDHAIVSNGTGVSDPATAWQLHTVSQSSIPYGMLTIGTLDSGSGTVFISVLLSPAGSFDLAVTAAQDGIDINGTGSPFAGFDPVELSGILENGAPVATTPESAVTPETGTTPAGGLTLPPLGATSTPETSTTPAGGLTLPPLDTTPAPDTTPVTGTTPGQGQSVVVNGADVTYTGAWTYEETTSTPDEIALFSHGASPQTLFGYAVTPGATGDAAGSLMQFNEGFFANFSATNVQQVALETLPNGRAWSLSTADQQGTPIVFLVLADTTTVPGEFRAQMLLTPAADFGMTLTDAQSAFQVDGAGAFAELDAAMVLSMVGGAPPVAATEEATASSATGAILSVTGDTAAFESQDTPATCDSLGWAATAEGHIPTTEQDINHRASCVGGSTYFAACGTVVPTDLGTPEPGMVWVRCDVSVRVDGAPLELTMFDFELYDATGAVYAFDLLGALASIQTVALFPEEPIATGQTATGSVIFSVPSTAAAAGPWVMSVNPVALQTTGEQPGRIVISGDLQAFETLAP